MKLLLIQGANLRSLGQRQGGDYDTPSAVELDATLRRHAERWDYSLEIVYTSSEGEAS